jgi:hypothetical protein
MSVTRGYFLFCKTEECKNNTLAEEHAKNCEKCLFVVSFLNNSVCLSVCLSVQFFTRLKSGGLSLVTFCHCAGQVFGCLRQ